LASLRHGRTRERRFLRGFRGETRWPVRVPLLCWARIEKRNPYSVSHHRKTHRLDRRKVFLNNRLRRHGRNQPTDSGEEAIVFCSWRTPLDRRPRAPAIRPQRRAISNDMPAGHPSGELTHLIEAFSFAEWVRAVDTSGAGRNNRRRCECGSYSKKITYTGNVPHEILRMSLSTCQRGLLR